MQNKYNGFDFDSKTPIKKLTVKQLSFFIVSVAFFAYFAFNVGKDIGLTIYNLLH